MRDRCWVDLDKGLEGVMRKSERFVVISRSEGIASPMRSIRILSSAATLARYKQWKLTFEALVGNHGIVEWLIIVIHHSLVAAFSNDFTELSAWELVRKHTVCFPN